MTLIGWVETGTDLEAWADAPEGPDLTRYLMSAFGQCLDFLPYTTDPTTGVQTPVIPPVIINGTTAAPATAWFLLGDLVLVAAPVPDRLVLAQVMQARALYRSALAGSGDGIGADGLSVTVFPMDWTVKNLLRPRHVGRVM